MIHGLSRPAAVRAVAVQLATFISYVDGPKHLLPRQQLSAELHRDRSTLSAIRLAVPAHDVIDHPGVRVDQVLPCSIGAERVETSSHSLEALVNRVPGGQRRRTGSAATARSWLFRPSRRITRRTAAYVSVAAIGAHPVPPWASQHPDESEWMRGAALVCLSHENQAVPIRCHRDRVPLSRLLPFTLLAFPHQRCSTSRAASDLLDISIEAGCPPMLFLAAGKVVCDSGVDDSVAQLEVVLVRVSGHDLRLHGSVSSAGSRSRSVSCRGETPTANR